MTVYGVLRQIVSICNRETGFGLYLLQIKTNR